jgi:hypothetical protein
VTVGLQLTAFTALATLTAPSSAISKIAPILFNVKRAKIFMSQNQKMAVAKPDTAEILSVSEKFAMPIHHHVNITKTVLLDKQPNAVVLTHAFATNQSVPTAEQPHVQKVTKELSLTTMNAVQRLSAFHVNTLKRQQQQKQHHPPQHHQLQHIPQHHTLPLLLLRQPLVELATPRPVKLNIMVKSGPFLNVKLVAVLLNSQSNAARSNALPQLHVQLAKPSLVHTPLTSAATLSTALQMNIVTNANWLSAQT